MALSALAALFLVVVALVTLGAVIAIAVTGAASWVGGVWIGPLVVIAVVLIATRSTRRSWRPVRDLIRAAGSLADGDYSVRVEPSGSAAIRPVATSFNEMARRLEQADEQRRRLLADVGHELRTPLTVVRGEIEAMLDGVHRADPDHLEQLLDEVTVMERLLGDLKTLAEAEAGALALHPEPTDIADLLADVADSYRRSAAEHGIDLEVDIGGASADAVVDPVRIREVVANLAVNALRAMPEGGLLTLRLRSTSDVSTIEVVDTGTGIAPQDLEVVFERFHKGSTSPGSGLGLTISKDLVEAHGGTITVESVQGAGTTVRVRLPRSRPTRRAAAP